MQRTAPFLAMSLAISITLTACASDARNYLSQHVLPVDPSGHLGTFAFDEPMLEDGGRGPRGSTIHEHIEVLLDGAEAFADRRDPDGFAEEVPLMIHLHGGRRTGAASARQSDDILTVMRRDADEREGDTDWYPVFVHWRSGDIDTATGRLIDLRQGRDINLVGGILTLPFVLAQDLARGVIKLPKSLVYQVYRDGAVAARVGFDVSPFQTWRDTTRITRAMQAEDGAAPTFDVTTPDYHRTRWVHAGRGLLYLPTQVAKIPVQAAFLEGLGQGAWDEMRRRARNLVWRPGTFEDSKADMPVDEVRRSMLADEADGALPQLFHAIGQRGRRYRLLLVAHSMGAIAMNDGLQCLAAAMEASGGAIEVERLLYMAPACSVIDAAEAIVPFLELSTDTHFHLMALHPIAEADEINLYDLVPRGSLLEWIDNFYTTPATHSERVFGKWANAIPSLALFTSVRDRVHFKAFSVGPGRIPTKHGHFHSIPFWRADAYTTDGESSFPVDWLGKECQRCIDEVPIEERPAMRW